MSQVLVTQFLVKHKKLTISAIHYLCNRDINGMLWGGFFHICCPWKVLKNKEDLVGHTKVNGVFVRNDHVVDTEESQKVK